MTPAPFALAAAAAVALFVCARADSKNASVLLRSIRAYGILKTNNDPPLLALLDKALLTHAHGPTMQRSGCMYEKQWHKDGSVVSTREQCLRCVCAHGALSCRRRVCDPMPDPLPRRCHMRHQRGSCCPELHCADRVQYMGHGAIAKFENEVYGDTITSSSNHADETEVFPACVVGGTVFAAGSAMGSTVACEQCFCLRGSRRCVAPTCLPPPPNCAPRPAAGVCCPQRYYCYRDTTDEPNQEKNKYDCLVNGNVVHEGEPVASSNNCTSCFCLRGVVRCQAMSCAPTLAGCRPLKAVGDCCAHQYHCDHKDPKGYPKSLFSPVSDNALMSSMDNNRSFHFSKSPGLDSTTPNSMLNEYTLKDLPNTAATQNQIITTTKVKRKTDEPPRNTSYTTNNTITQEQGIMKIYEPDEHIDEGEFNMQELDGVDLTITTELNTEQPEGTVKIIINGTINCTTELSSTSLPLSISNESKMQLEAIPRMPIVNIEAQTYPPNDIITDRTVNSGFYDDDTFTINVTSSLMTNTSSGPVKTPVKLKETLNSSKINKDDYDFDYTEPTLPPSLPNLKIIPFVAADAVVDKKPSRNSDKYQIIEKVDNFPVYYPLDNTKRPDDFYQTTPYPVFISEITGTQSVYLVETQNDEFDNITSDQYPMQNELGGHDTKSSSLGHTPDVTAVTNKPAESSTKRPAVNLFSPPVETEGGFIPKEPSNLDEYFPMYASTTSRPSASVSRLTTSMQLDSGDCVTEDGRKVSEGGGTSVGCLQCSCMWGSLRCLPRDCGVPAGCHRVPLHERSLDPCCGDLVCTADNYGPPAAIPVTVEDSKNNSGIITVKLEVLPLDGQTLANQSDTASSTINEVTTQKTSETNLTSSTISVTKPLQTNADSISNTTTTAPTFTTSAKPEAKLTSSIPAAKKEANDTSQEYEDEEEDDGFSFGSVLKLLLSDNYESTTAAPFKRPSVKPTIPPTTNTRRPASVAPFIPLPPHPYNPSKKSPSSVNRIDHLVLGEATAIKRTTSRPITNKTTKVPSELATTETRPEVTTAGFVSSASDSYEGPRPPNLALLPGSGFLKLAGCNIYGRIYRVGRIITELSTPCTECWCTVVGVHCKPLSC